MLKTYRIIPYVFILFLFGFTLITASPVIAEDSPEFVACQQINPSGDFRLMKEKKNCFRDVMLQDHSKANQVTLCNQLYPWKHLAVKLLS